jgi:hypothetical protein
MANHPSLKILFYKTIHRNAKSAEQIADEIGISYSYLCRFGLSEDSGADCPTKFLIPLMKSAGDYSILRHIATLCGFLLVKAPRGLRDKLEEAEAINKYNYLCTQASRLLIEFFKSPSPKLLSETNDALQDVMEYSATLSRRIKDFNQMEMEL